MAATRVRSASSASLPKRLTPRKHPGQDRSRALVEALGVAAARVLVRQGYEGFSMKALADEAGVSPGSLYQYFADKDAVVTHLIEQLSEREVAFQLGRAAALPPTATLEEVLEALVDGVLAFQAAEGPLMRAALGALPYLGRYPALANRARLVASGLEQVVAQHLGAEVAPVATWALANAVHALTHDGILPRPQGLTDAGLKAEVMRLVRGYLRAGAR